MDVVVSAIDAIPRHYWGTKMNTLAQLNTLRVAAGMKPLKAWKESKVKLEAAIAKLAQKLPEATDPTPAQRATVERMAKEVIAKTSGRAAATGDNMQQVPKAKPANTEGLISIATIADELDIDPKVARAKLRRAGNVTGSSDSRWMFTKEQAAAAKAILSGDKRKK